MGYTASQVRELLKEHGLRATRPRLAVVQMLSRAHEPLSCSEVLKELEDEGLTMVTVYRNLVRLREVGMVKVVSKSHGCDHYALTEHDQVDHHPHFECIDCGRTTCLPNEASPKVELEGKWAVALRSATIHFHGTCPDCAEGGT